MVLTKSTQIIEDAVTAEELWRLAEGNRNYELVQGELVEMTPPGAKHGRISAKISRFLDGFAGSHNLGEVMVETGYQLEHRPDTVRSPDISFLSGDKMPEEGLPDGFIEGAPTLAIEVVSPNDTASEIQSKVQTYLAHDTQLVWVVYPQQRIVVVHYPDGTARTLGETDSLDGEKVIPGFSCQVKDIFD